ncbi:MAG: NTP transferase domain-containing protein [Halohasta sp.]
MDAVIVAAGEGRRMDGYTDGVPKLFLELHGTTLYERQLARLEPVCDRLFVVLGYGFVDEPVDRSRDDTEGGLDGPPDDPSAASPEAFDGEIHVVGSDQAAAVDSDGGIDLQPSVDSERSVDRESIARRLATDRDITVSAVVVPHWDRVENAESCRHGLRHAEGDVLLLNGDIVYSDAILRTVLDRYDRGPRRSGRSLVAVKEGIQNEMTAVRWNGEGLITDYGAIEGHQVAGIFVVNRQHRERACEVLAERPTDWFPVVFPAIESTYVAIPPADHFEINTPAHYAAAKRGL